jgi:hypothetical protein
VRKWSSTIVNTDGAECNNCHGVWTAWVDNVVHRTDSNPETMHGSSSGSPNFGCNECHGWNSAQYDFSPKWDGGSGTNGNHGDQRITMNANGSNVARNGGGLTGCSACHEAFDGETSPNHSFTTVTRWTFQTITDGPFSGCAACHGDTSANTYWPDDTASTDRTNYPDRAGQHLVHVKRIGERLGYGSTPASYDGTQQQTICGFCHDDQDSGSGGVGPSGHYPSDWSTNKPAAVPADVLNLNQLWGPDDPDEVYTAATYSGGGAWNGGATCATVDCHYNVEPQAWYASATVGCNTCHSSTGTTNSGEPWPNVGGHSAHDAAFGINDNTVCATCHTGYVPNSFDNLVINSGDNHINGNPTRWAPTAGPTTGPAQTSTAMARTRLPPGGPGISTRRACRMPTA